MTNTSLQGGLAFQNLASFWRFGQGAALILAFLVVGGAFSLQLSGLDPHAPVGADSASAQSEIAIGAGLIVMAAFGAAAWRRVIALLKANMLLLTLPALALLSAAWAPEPAVALRRASAFAATVLGGVSVAAYLPGAQALRLLVQTVAAGVLLSIAYVAVCPGYAIHQLTDGVQSVHAGDWRGLFVHRTALGQLAALSLALAAYAGKALGHALIRLGVILASVLCLVMAHSGGGLASAAILLATPLLWKAIRRAARRNWLMAAGLGLGAAILAALLTPILAPLILQVLGKDATLTGRTDLWRLMIDAVLDKPLFGYGYSTGFREVVAKLIAAHSPYGYVPNAQNGYLDVALNLGLVGLMLALAVLGLAFRRAIRCAIRSEGDDSLGLPPLLIAVFIAELNIVEAALISASDIFVLIFVTAIVASGDIAARRPLSGDDRHALCP